MLLSHQSFNLKDHIVLERIVFRPPMGAPASMPNEACFLYAINGRSRVYGAQGSLPLHTSDAVVMQCGNYLNKWEPTESDDPCEAVAVHFCPEILEQVYDHDYPDFIKQTNTPHPHQIEAIQVDQMVRNYVESLIFYFANPSLVNDELVKLKVKELLLLLVNTDQNGELKGFLGDMFRPKDHSFRDIIRQHHLSNLTIPELAHLCGLSESSFKRKFKEVFAESPARYLKQKKLEKAAELLKIGGLRVSDIAYDCGFSDLAHFSKSFTAHFGASPSDYRDQP